MLVKIIAFPLNSLTQLKFYLKKTNDIKGIISQREKCTTSHQALFEQMKKQFKVIGTRDLEYLNWKFVEHPNYEYKRFDAFQGNQLIGSIFFIVKNRTW